MKKAHVVFCILLTLGTLVAAQASRTVTTVPYQVNSSFPGCNGDLITLAGSYEETTTQWFDNDGNLHTRTQINSSSLSATSADISYTVIFSQKLVETETDDDLTVAQTATIRLKLKGPGSLNNQMFFTEMHVTFPQGAGSPPDNNKFWAKCTG